MKSEHDTRARVTLPDLVYWTVALGFFAAIYPIAHQSLVDNINHMSTGTQYMAQLILPFALLVLFSLIYVKAIGGRPQ